METQNDTVEFNADEHAQASEEQLTVDVPIEVRAGGAYNCCKRTAE
jgi:hypothetical protein